MYKPRTYPIKEWLADKARLEKMFQADLLRLFPERFDKPDEDLKSNPKLSGPAPRP